MKYYALGVAYLSLTHFLQHSHSIFFTPSATQYGEVAMDIVQLQGQNEGKETVLQKKEKHTSIQMHINMALNLIEAIPMCLQEL